jgi:hypothetical protein
MIGNKLIQLRRIAFKGGTPVRMPDAPAADFLRLEDELENLVRLTLNRASDRNINVVVRFFGFDGTGKRTLEEVGQAFGVTRERVRQITSNLTRRLQRRNLYLPIFRSACNHILENLPSSVSALGRSLHKQEITRTDFDVSGIGSAIRLLDEEDLFDIISIGQERLAVRKNEGEYFLRVPRIARAIVSAFGCGHIEHILAELEIGPEQTFDVPEVAKALDQIPDVRWLDQEHEWFTIVDTKRNRLSNIVRKVLSVAPKIWPAPGLDDTQLSKSGLPLELHRAQITDRRVSAFRVVEALDIVKHVCLCFIARPVRFIAGALGLQRREEALHRSVVPHVA